MTEEEKLEQYRKLRNRYYWLSFGASFVFPFVFFALKLGFTQEVTKIVLPTVIVAVVGAMKLASDMPRWIGSWEPSFLKGMIGQLPKVVLFVVLITLGLTMKYVIEHQIEIAFVSYFETVFVLFGGSALGGVFAALNQKYRELYLLSKGYVLGVVNK